MKIKLCAMCGKEFVAEGNRKYCSEECSAKAKLKNWRNYRARKEQKKSFAICVLCGREFETSAANKKYCSDECRRYARQETFRESKRRKAEEERKEQFRKEHPEMINASLTLFIKDARRFGRTYGVHRAIMDRQYPTKADILG